MLLARRSADYYLACSDAAGRYYFGEKRLPAPNDKVIKNGIMVDRYAFDAQKRAAKCAELGIEDCFVLGSVGWFVPEKNHKQMLEIFAELMMAMDVFLLPSFYEGLPVTSIEAQTKWLQAFYLSH